jgi:hypothetical protein
VSGDLLMNGVYTGSSELIHNGTGYLDGIGTISTSGNLTLAGGSKQILSSAVLKRTSGSTNLNSGITIFNNGVFKTTGDIVGAASSSTWINEPNSILNIRGNFLSTGTIVVNTVPNTVEYSSTVSQSIVLTDYYNLYCTNTGARVLPSSGTVGIAGEFQQGTNTYTVTGSTLDFNGSIAQDVPSFTYNNLIVSNGDVKTMTGAVTCNGSISIQSGTTFDLSGYSLVSKGNFVNNGIFTHSGGSTSFNGTGLQTVSGNTTSFNDFTLNNSAGLTLNTSINIDNDLIVTSGALGFGSTAKNVYVTGNISGSGSITMTGGGLAHTLTLEGSTNTLGSFSTTAGSGSTVNYVLSGDQTMLPGTYQHLVTSGSNTKTATGATTIEGNLAIGTDLTIADAGFTITIKGNITNNGIHSGAGKILLSGGSATHTLSGGTFGNLELNDGFGASATSAALIQNILTLTSGTLTSGGNLTVDLTTGSIAGTGSGSVSGNITTMKNINSNKYHMVSGPLSGLTFSEWDDDVRIQSDSYANLYSYDETKTDTAKTVGWTAQTSLASPITSFKGFAMYFTGATTIDQTGPYVHSSSYSNTGLTNTVSNTGGAFNPAADGWNLIGNPYPSALDWNSASGWTKTGLDGAIYFWDPINSRYASYVIGAGTNGGTQYIPSMQAFWVKVNAPGTGTLAATNSVRVTSSNPSVWRFAEESPILTLSAGSGNYNDETVIRFREDALEIFDSQLDAYKMTNEDYTPTLYTELYNTQYSINSLPYNLINSTIPVKLSAAFTGSYTFTAKQVANFNPGDSILFVDKLLNITKDLRSQPTYTCTINQGDTTGRFYINFKKAASETKLNSPVPSITVQSSQEWIDLHFINENSSEASIGIYNTLGEPVFGIENADISSKEYRMGCSRVPGGVYIVKVITGSQNFAQKIFIFK